MRFEFRLKHIFFCCCFTASVVIFLAFLLNAYWTYNISFPVGWDPAVYIFSARRIVQIGLLNYIVTNGYPNLYMILLSAVSFLTSNFTISEMVMPPVLSILLLFVNFLIARKASNNSYLSGLSFIFSISISTIWLVSNLHRQLLTLLLVWSAFYILTNGRPYTLSKKMLVVAMLTLASWTHVETFGLALLTLLIYLAIFRDKSAAKLVLTSTGISLVLLLPLAPRFISISLLLVGNFSPSNAPLLGTYQLYLGGMLFPLALFGLLKSLHSFMIGKQRIAAVLTIWSFLIIIGAALTYIEPIYPAWRMLMLLPTPVLLVLGLKAITDLLKAHARKISITFQWQGAPSKPSHHRISLTTIVLLSLLLPSVYISVIQGWQAANQLYRPWITNSAVEKLRYIAANIVFDKTPIFVLYGYSDPGLAGLHNLWISAVVGEHFTYYGRIDWLLNKTQLTIGQEFLTSTFYDELSDMSDDAFLGTPTVVISDFYPQQTEFLRRFEISNGIYVFRLKDLPLSGL